MTKNNNLSVISIFIKWYIVFGCVLFTISYFMFDKVHLVYVLLATLLFASVQSYKNIRKSSSNIKA